MRDRGAAMNRALLERSSSGHSIVNGQAGGFQYALRRRRRSGRIGFLQVGSKFGWPGRVRSTGRVA